MWAAVVHCSEAGQAVPYLLSEEERTLCVRMYVFLLNEHLTHKHLNTLTFGAWALGRSHALLLSSDRQDDGLAAGGGRVTLRAPPMAMALPTGTPRFPLDIWLLARSSSSHHRSRWPGVIPSWEEPGADEDLDLVICCWKARRGMT